MAQVVEIKKVTVGPRYLDAVVEVGESAPLMTSDDAEGTARIMDLIPELADHVCLGDNAPTFGDVVDDTEVAHLLEHVTVELLARTNIAGDITSGRTAEVGERTYVIRLDCPDDVLVIGALSSAEWVLEWAYNGGGDPVPDIDAIASGLVSLVQSLGDDSDDGDGQSAEPEEPVDEEYPEGEHVEELEYEDAVIEPADSTDPGSTLISEPITLDDAPEPEPSADELDEPDDVTPPEPEQPEQPEVSEQPAAPAAPVAPAAPESGHDIYDDSPAIDDWDMVDVPKPRPVR